MKFFIAASMIIGATTAFAPQRGAPCFSVRASNHQSSSTLQMAGFGSSKATNKKSKLKPLKPKQQWDRYGDFAKSSTNFAVGVRVVGRDDCEQEWLRIGYVNSKDDSNIELAVSRQRSLIAEHAKRLLPLAVLPKDKVEWGYVDAEGEWKKVESLNEYPSSFEKSIGFEGIGDPKSGYYCHYKDGKVVAMNEGGAVTKSEAE
mmetsp:Transcript_16466/g.25695  ORF Transcript_16466/g.25695 Transcript_16466/m.25695 type:complete len:202 (-) Transcript_16466:109-714(-)